MPQRVWGLEIQESLYRAFTKSVAREFAKYNLGLVGIQDDR